MSSLALLFQSKSFKTWSPRIILVYIVYKLVKYAMSKVRVNVAGKSVVITGCDSGFGLMTTHRLSRGGIHVFAACLTQEGVEKLSNTRNVTPILMDVTDEKSVAAAFEIVQQNSPKGIWGLINNAGVLRSGAFEVMPISHWRLQMNVNVLGIAITTRTFFPLLLKGKGRIVNIASVAGRFATPGTSGYNASKFAVEGLSDSWRREFKTWGIKVIIIEPGIMKTPLWDVPIQEADFDAVWKSLSEEQRVRYGMDYFKLGEKSAKELIAKLGGDPIQVINALEHSIVSKFPNTRYTVGSDTLLWINLSRLPTFLGDYLISKIMKSPKPACFQNKNK